MNKVSTEELLARITIVPGVMGGRPIVRAMRFTVSDILEMLASGMNGSEILQQHPMLEKEDIAAALFYAALTLNNTRIIHAA